TCAVRVRARQDRLQPVVAVRVRELVAAQADTGVVVHAMFVRLPQIDSSAANRTAPARQDVTAERDLRPVNSGPKFRVTHGRRLEVRPADLTRGDDVAVATTGCGRWRSGDRTEEGYRQDSDGDALTQAQHERH